MYNVSCPAHLIYNNHRLLCSQPFSKFQHSVSSSDISYWVYSTDIFDENIPKVLDVCSELSMFQVNKDHCFFWWLCNSHIFFLQTFQRHHMLSGYAGIFQNQKNHFLPVYYWDIQKYWSLLNSRYSLEYLVQYMACFGVKLCLKLLSKSYKLQWFKLG